MGTELIMGMEEIINYLKELEAKNKTLTEENKELKEELDVWVNPNGQIVMNQEGMLVYEASQEENKKLKEELDISNGRVGPVPELKEEIKELTEENKKLTEENKKFQEDFDDKEHWQQTMVSYMDYGDQWCNFDRWFGENIDEDDKKQEWVKIWMENTEYEDSDDEESDEEEITEPESDKP